MFVYVTMTEMQMVSSNKEVVSVRALTSLLAPYSMTTFTGDGVGWTDLSTRHWHAVYR